MLCAGLLACGGGSACEDLQEPTKATYYTRAGETSTCIEVALVDSSLCSISPARDWTRQVGN